VSIENFMGCMSLQAGTREGRRQEEGPGRRDGVLTSGTAEAGKKVDGVEGGRRGHTRSRALQ